MHLQPPDKPNYRSLGPPWHWLGLLLAAAAMLERLLLVQGVYLTLCGAADGLLWLL